MNGQDVSFKMITKLMKRLSPEQEEIVLKEVGYTRKQLSSDSKLIRKWLNDQHHLPPSRLKESDDFLTLYLTGCKGSLENVKKKLDNYYSIRNYSEVYEVRDPQTADYLATRNLCSMANIPHLSEKGERLYISTLHDFDEKFDFLSFARIIVNRAEYYFRNCVLCSRIYLLIDCNGASPKFILKLKSSVLRDILFFVQEISPARYIKFGLINVPGYLDVTLNNLVKPLLSKKLQERFYITSGGHEDILNYFSPNVLPRDYGGHSDNPSLQEYSEMWAKEEDSNRDLFLNEFSERVDESKRVNLDNVSKNPYFGVHGSLKKLVID